MPVYVYKNLSTNETFEVTQRMTEPALTSHPETGDPVKRLIQPVGIAFRGSGFYVNDSKAARKSAAKVNSESKADKPAESTPESKSESKADSKTDSKPSKTSSESTVPASSTKATPSPSTRAD